MAKSLLSNKDKVYTTNYYNAFIVISDDCPVYIAEVPPLSNRAFAAKTVARLTFDMIMKHPYRYTSDEVLFEVYMTKNGFNREKDELRRKDFFSRKQSCLRSSPLVKRYGWGIHHNEEGKVALVPMESHQYLQMAHSTQLKVMKGIEVIPRGCK